MVRLLVEDMFRRIAFFPVAFMLFMLWAGWLMLGFEHQAAQSMALSLGAAFALGPICIPFHAATPLTPYLPVSRRDTWRATWLMATILPALTAAVLMLPAVALGGAPGWSGLTLALIMDVAYAGTGCALLAFGSLLGSGPFALSGGRG